MNKVIFWDFDGTLVTFTSWRPAIVQVLDEHDPGHNVDAEIIRPFLKNGFPWHTPEVPHLHLNTPDAWWRALEPVFTRTYMGVGYSPERAAALAPLVRRYMARPERFKLFEDTIPVMEALNARGWRHAILSNHMPELASIAGALGLWPNITGCFSSAVTGYEKPNPQAYRLALEACGNPEKAWMVGDNVNADVKGSEAAGIPAILVRVPRPDDIKHYAADLHGAAEIILKDGN